MFGFLPGPSFCCAKAATGYRAHFCGLCNGLHRDYGIWARWLINRDSTFLALLGTALSPCGPATCKTTCCNPWGTPHDLLDSSTAVHYAAAVTLCGLTTKLDDDAADEHGPRRWLALTGQRALEEASATALGVLHALHFPVAAVTTALRGQDQAEQPGTDLLTAAGPTCISYGEIVAHTGALAGGTAAVHASTSALRTIGHHLGFLIYAQDAWEDWDKDRRRGRFNALHTFTSVTDRRAYIAPLLHQALAAMRQAFASLPLHRNRDLLNLVLIEGAEHRVQEVLTTAEDRERDHREKLRQPPPKKRKKDKKEKSGCCSRCDCGDCGGGHGSGSCCDVCECCTKCPKAASRGSKGGGGSGNECCDCNPCDGDGCDCCGCDCG